MALEAGHAFGNYQLVRLIGEGGFGEVYLAENPLIKRRAAVKVLLPELARSAEVVGRFLNEARAASAIRHPNIVEVLDAGATPDGAPYILMEFLEGEPLHRRMARQGSLDVEQVIELAQQAGSALAAAHAAGIVHRDLKPENLFLVPDQNRRGGDLLKILDFGIAKIMTGEASTGTVKTRAGLIMGSPVYMSPEQCKDTGRVDLRTDIYSLAVILYEALAGRPPYLGESGTELMIMHLTADPPPLGDLVPDLAPHVSGAIMHALAREPNDRFQDMGAFMRALSGEQGMPDRQVIDRPSGRVRPRPEATAILASGTGAAKAKMPAARGPAGARGSNTTLSRSTGESFTEAGERKASSERRFPRKIVGAAVVVALGGAAVLSVVMVRRGGPAKEGRTPSASSQPNTPEPSVKPPELATPRAGEPAPRAAAAPEPVPTVAAEPAPARPTPEPKPAVPGETPTSSRPRPAAGEGEREHRTPRTRVSGRTELSSAKPVTGKAHTSEPTAAPETQPAAPVIKRQKF